MTPDRVVRVSLSVAWGFVATVTAYAALRLEGSAGGESVPAAAWSAHAGFFWRAWTAAYVGGMVGIIASTAARVRPRAVSSALGPAAAISAALLGLASALRP